MGSVWNRAVGTVHSMTGIMRPLDFFVNCSIAEVLAFFPGLMTASLPRRSLGSLGAFSERNRHIWLLFKGNVMTH